MERKIISDKSLISIKNLNPQKRPVSAVADNIEFRMQKISIKVNRKIKFNLLYDKIEVCKKIKIEELRKET